MHPDVVAFDLDGTLTVRDCVIPFLVGTGGGVRALSAAVAAPVRAVGPDRRDGLKRHLVRACLGGLPEERIREKGANFARRVATGWMRPDVVRRLREHQDAGDVVVIVSASLDAYVQPLGDILEVDAVLCTEVEYREGVATGELIGENCRGAEKVKRLVEWATGAGFGGMGGSTREAWLRTAYGDSSGDSHMLAAAEEGILVRGRELGT